MVYPPLGSEIERFRIRNEQTDEQKKFVAGISTEIKVTVLLLYKARHDCGKLQKGRVVLTSKNKKNNGKEKQHP